MEARDQFGEVLNEVCYQGNIITIERRGKPMATLVPVQFIEARQQAIERITENAEATHKRNKGISAKVIDQEVLKAVREVRQKS